VIGEARVQGGDARHVGLVAPQDVPIAVLRGGERPNLTAELRYDGPLQAPFAKGTQAGWLVMHARYRAGSQSFTVPLVTSDAVGKAGPLDRLWNGIMGVFS
jgi:D-alanyl-D-alanine carboxypeptidase (penicillin-binding protein 5/6)